MCTFEVSVVTVCLRHIKAHKLISWHNYVCNRFVVVGPFVVIVVYLRCFTPVCFKHRGLTNSQRTLLTEIARELKENVQGVSYEKEEEEKRSM